jgi:hypothetical protein
MLIECVTNDAGGSLAYSVAPQFAIFFLRSAQQKKSLQNLCRHCNQKSSLSSLLSKLIIITQRSITLALLLKPWYLPIKQLKGSNRQLLFTAAGKCAETRPDIRRQRDLY